MVWGDMSGKKGVAFKNSKLPSGTRDPGNQGLIGVGLSVPEVKFAEEVPSAGAAAVKSTFGERSWQRDISPAHRKIIREYFSEKVESRE